MCGEKEQAQFRALAVAYKARNRSYFEYFFIPNAGVMTGIVLFLFKVWIAGGGIFLLSLLYAGWRSWDKEKAFFLWLKMVCFGVFYYFQKVKKNRRKYHCQLAHLIKEKTFI